MTSIETLTADRPTLLREFDRVRQASIEMCSPLEPEDFRLQPMEDVSPPWWNLGHTSWFFVRNVLEPFGGRMEPEDAEYDYLLNSYYVSLGPRLRRADRGSLSRPTTPEIYRYRASVDERVKALVASIDDGRFGELAWVMNVGLQHEQQHQELFYTEIKNILAQNLRSLRRPYAAPPAEYADCPPAERRFVPFDGGLFEFGHREAGWCWDNELPVHKYYLRPFSFDSQLVTCEEYLEFIDGGGYSNPLFWLDNGWAQVRHNGWQAPLYWEKIDGAWWLWTLSGMRPLVPAEPVCHVSFYEADAFASWKSQAYHSHRGARLPSEREWEHAARVCGPDESPGAFVDSGRLHPSPAGGASPVQMAGILWQWTSSHYEPYPGYRPFPGALTEYNGKFMDNQRVLRGGSCATPRDHFRISYRNFWAAPTRFQFTGIRLARDEED